MSYWIAGIDVHEKMLAVVLADVEVDGEWQFDRRRWGMVGEPPVQRGVRLGGDVLGPWPHGMFEGGDT